MSRARRSRRHNGNLVQHSRVARAVEGGKTRLPQRPTRNCDALLADDPSGDTVEREAVLRIQAPTRWRSSTRSASSAFAIRLASGRSSWSTRAAADDPEGKRSRGYQLRTPHRGTGGSSSRCRAGRDRDLEEARIRFRSNSRRPRATLSLADLLRQPTLHARPQPVRVAPRMALLWRGITRRCGYRHAGSDTGPPRRVSRRLGLPYREACPQPLFGPNLHPPSQAMRQPVSPSS